MLVNVILVIAFLGFIGGGWKDGFVHTAGRVVGAVIGFVLARTWSDEFAPIFGILLPTDWARLASFLAIFVLITRLAGFIFKLADNAFRILSILPFLKTINNFFGAIAGFFEGIVILGGTMWVLRSFNLLAFLQKLLASSPVARAINRAFEFLLAAIV